MTRKLSLVLALTASLALIAGPAARKTNADDFLRNAAGAALIMGGVANMIQATQPQVNYVHGGFVPGGYPVYPGQYPPNMITYPPANVYYPPANVYVPPTHIYYPTNPGYAPGGVVPIVYPTNPQFIPTPF